MNKVVSNLTAQSLAAAGDSAGRIISANNGDLFGTRLGVLLLWLSDMLADKGETVLIITHQVIPSKSFFQILSLFFKGKKIIII